MNARHFTVLSSAAAVVLLSTAAAFAQPGVATGAVNVRTGPGTGYSKVGTLSPGEPVDVKDCQGSWCFVDRNAGIDGWVSASYLQPVAAQPAPGPSEPDIPFNFGVTVGPGGPSFSFGIGGGPGPVPAPPPAPAITKVCFFKASNFAGEQFCVGPGDSGAVLINWNDAISSISLQGGAQVTVCKNPHYGGSCATITTSKATLGSYNNAISSFQAL